jgi:hypothetical protein
MIGRNDTLTMNWLPLSRLCVKEYQHRYLDRVIHYVNLLDRDTENRALGFLIVKPLFNGQYEILDGHHRYCAYVIAGRSDALCIVVEEG